MSGTSHHAFMSRQLVATDGSDSANLAPLAGELNTEQFTMAIPDQCDTELAELVSVLRLYAWRRRLALDVDTACVLIEDDFHQRFLPRPRSSASRPLLVIDSLLVHRPFVSEAW